MIFLKKFNESLEELSKRITMEEWVAYDLDHKGDKISSKEEEEIMEIFSIYWKVWKRRPNCISFVCFDDDYDECGAITKYDDGWYIVSHEHGPYGAPTDIWKCDGIDGVKDIFKK